MSTMKVLSYNSKEKMIGAIIMPPVAVIINYFIFGQGYFSSLPKFLWPTIVTILIVLLVYVLCSMVATMLLHQFPTYRQTFKRIGISLFMYVAIMAIAITILFYGYDYINIAGLQVKMENYWWVIIVGAGCNLLATSFNEGAAFLKNGGKWWMKPRTLKKKTFKASWKD